MEARVLLSVITDEPVGGEFGDVGQVDDTIRGQMDIATGAEKGVKVCCGPCGGDGRQVEYVHESIVVEVGGDDVAEVFEEDVAVVEGF